MDLLNRTVANSGKFSLALSMVAVLAACGQAPQTNLVGIDTGIIGGTEATGAEDYAKHTVILYDTKLQALCTGSLLSDSILVTAAHCVDSEAGALRVGFGTDMQSKDIVVQPVDAYQVSPIWKFRQNMEFNSGDIALVRFSGGLPKGKGFSPVNFLSDVSKLTNNMDVTVAGYGASKAVRVRDPKTGALVSDHTGSGKLRGVVTTMKKVNYSKSEFLLESAKGKSACHGDSGGPAYVKVEVERNGKIVLEDVLTGVTSRGVGDELDLCNVSAAYTSIPFYSSWIVSTARALDAAVLAERAKVVAAQ